MKKLMIFTCIILVHTLSAWTQTSIIIKLGATPRSGSFKHYMIVNRNNPREEFKFSTLQVKPQFYAGVSARLQMRTPFFLEAGMTYTEKTSLYQVNYRMPTETNPAEMVMSEKEKILLLPVNIGVSLGKIDITSGLSAMKTLTKAKELTHLQGFHQDDNAIRVGWQMGARYAIGRTMLGIEYQGTLNREGQGMYVNKQSLEQNNVPGNFVFSVQFGF
ncbi:MAG: hypothetical protein IPP15_15500 [Saprospiraceae bacterium]|uniref:Outer membrane protein beta-barrel domain-containing protein n=1 Tax=Candidatus Opimibacter skivensis TaxID=2982028 RepID=A0A9D7SY09_9BACT|nr:hypothetical protein [Candidatus Opimibacter skivensis]